MDKNTFIGFLLIGALLFGFTWYNQPSERELEQQTRHEQSELQLVKNEEPQSSKSYSDAANSILTGNDSLKDATLGIFAQAPEKEERIYTIENEVLCIKISSKGGQIIETRLKNFTTNKGDSLYLFQSKNDETSFGFLLATADDRMVSTSELNFEAVNLSENNIVENGEKTFVFRLRADESSYVDYVYTISASDYMIGLSVQLHNMQHILGSNMNSTQLLWNTKIKQQERSKKFENRYAQLYYKPLSDDPESLSEVSNEKEDVTTKIKWIAFKDQFFSSVLIAESSFSSATLKSTLLENDEKYLKHYEADILASIDPTGKICSNFKFYFGPNNFKLLKSYDDIIDNNEEKLQMEKLVPLGWGIFGWINQYVVIPIFNFLSQFISNFGVIILILTLIIKVVLFPLTYKSYLSTAKMRVLKPQIEEINKKIPETKPQERQRAMMNLYSKVGINPMGGCIPMLLQMPILFAMFCFFPASIELRQESFLWAQDLSSYDAIVAWETQIPFLSKYFGNHLSLFCLLMTITNLIYTHINMKTQDTGSQQMPGMKWMMYLMPLMFLFIFNDYASGLSYYYFISTVITIVQTLVIRSFVDEKKLLQKLNDNAKKPRKKTSFLERLQEAQRKQLELQRQQQKKKK